MTLQDILAGYTGTQTSAPAVQPAVGGGGLSPLVQSLLAGYFSAIGSPKLAGWGGALSRGGLGALGQYEQARYQQQLEDLRAAQAELARAKAGGGTQSVSAAQQIRAAAQSLSGQNQKIAMQMANAVESGSMDPEKAFVQLSAMAQQESAVKVGTGLPGAVPYIYRGATGQLEVLGQPGAGAAQPSAPTAQQPQAQQPSAQIEIDLDMFSPEQKQAMAADFQKFISGGQNSRQAAKLVADKAAMGGYGLPANPY